MMAKMTSTKCQVGGAKMNLKLNDLYEEQIYPKKRIFRVFPDYSKPLNDTGYSYCNEENAMPIFYELDNCLNEKNPCGVVVANLTILFWMLKGPNYNYGGLKKQFYEDSNLIQKYLPMFTYKLAQRTRENLEKYADTILPELKKKYPIEYRKIELIYTKLLLLIYDLSIDSLVFGTAGSSWTTKKYEVSEDYSGKTIVREGTDYHNNYRTVVKESRELCSEQMYQGFVKGRQILAEKVRMLDAIYPINENTWLYYKIDIDELRENVNPFYDILLTDKTQEDKRFNVYMIPEPILTLRDFCVFWFNLPSPLEIFGINNPFRKKKKEIKELRSYHVGKLTEEEINLRKTIYLNGK